MVRDENIILRNGKVEPEPKKVYHRTGKIIGFPYQSEYSLFAMLILLWYPKNLFSFNSGNVIHVYNSSVES